MAAISHERARVAGAGRAAAGPAGWEGSFRTAMGCFATGVTIVTVASGGGDIHGMTRPA